MFWCPGCDQAHWIDSRWTFDGDLERPTFHPSVLVYGVKRCHSFIRAGNIQFLADCSHELAGSTVALPDIASTPWADDET